MWSRVFIFLKEHDKSLITSGSVEWQRKVIYHLTTDGSESGVLSSLRPTSLVLKLPFLTREDICPVL